VNKMNFDLSYFFKVIPVIGRALPVTLSIAILSMVLGLVLGTAITFILKHAYWPIKEFFKGYVSFFRGTPLMVQLFIFFYGVPQLLPFLSRITAYATSVLVMSINASAYISEVIRSSLNSVDTGQLEAATAMGMTKFQAMERIILPQAFRIAIPPLGNTFINLIQGTALTFMLGLKDIMGISKMLAASSYRFFEAYLAVGLIYWVITKLASIGNKYLERRLDYEK